MSVPRRLMRLGPVLAVGLSTQAYAGEAVIISPNPHGPDLGRIAQRETATSVWRIAADTGEVSLLEGDAVRLTTGPANPPMITLECPTQACRGAVITAAFTPIGGARATILGFTPGVVTSRGLTVLHVSGAGTTHLVMTFLAGPTPPASAAFPLGMTVRLSAGGRGAAPTYGYSMVVTLH